MSRYAQKLSAVVVSAVMIFSLLLAAAPASAGYTGWYYYATGYSCGQYLVNLTSSPHTLDKTYDKAWKKGTGATTMVFQHIAYSSLDGRMHVYGPSDARPVPNNNSTTTNVYALPNLRVNHPQMWLEHHLFVDGERKPYTHRRYGTDNGTGCTQAGYPTAYDYRLSFSTSFPASAPYIPLP